MTEQITIVDFLNAARRIGVTDINLLLRDWSEEP